MRRIGIVLAALLLLLSLAACSAQETTSADISVSEPEENADQFEEAEAQQDNSGPFGEKDMVFVADGVEYAISTPAQPLLDLFGSEYEEIVAPSCSFVGEDKQFIYDFATVYTYPMDEVDLINEIYIYGGDFVTNRGIALGDTLDMVVEAYGEGGFEDGESYVYALNGDKEDASSPRLYFDIADGVVVSISYFGANGIML